MSELFKQRYVKTIVAVTYLTYAVSFFLPAGVQSGAEFNGFMAFVNALCLCWCLPIWHLNLLLWLSAWTFMRRKPNWTLGLSVVGFFFGYYVILAFSSGTYVIRPMIGYYVWMACPVIMSVGAIGLALMQSGRQASKPGAEPAVESVRVGQPAR